MENNNTNQPLPAPAVEEMEQAVVFAILAEPEGIFEVAGRLRPEMFTNRDLALVFRAMLQLYKGSLDIDMLTIEQEMFAINREQAGQLGGLAFIADQMLKVYSALHIRTYAAWVLRNWALRQCIARMSKRIAQASDVHADVMKLMSEVHRDMQQLEEEFADTSTTRPVSEVGSRVLAEIQDEQRRRRSGEVAHISTGLSDLDDLVGGLYRGELLMLGGRPSMGKTALAIHMALAAARQGRKTCIFSLEMTERQLLSRILCLESGVEPDKLRFKLLTREECERLDKAVRKLQELPLYLNYCSETSLEEIRAKCMVMHRRGELEVVFIDYLNLIPVPSAVRGDLKDTMDLALGDIVRRVKAMVMDLNIAGVVLAQLNRNCESRADHTPQMSDLRNSGEIEQVADSIALVYRPEMYGITVDSRTHENLAGKGRLIIAKNRNGPTGMVGFGFRNGKVEEITMNG